MRLVAGGRFAMTGASDGLVRLWSLEEVYSQAQEATWGLPAPSDDAASAHSTCTDAACELGQEVSTGHLLAPAAFPHAGCRSNTKCC